MCCLQGSPKAWAAGVLGLVLSIIAVLWPLEPATPAVLDRLVKSMTAPRFKNRGGAIKKENAIGARTMRLAIQSRDTQMQRRPAERVAATGSEKGSATALAPTKVRLKANNVPLAEVLRDLSQQSKIRLFLAQEPANLGERVVTLDTGETSFWEALDALCRQAKIHLRPMLPEPTEGNTGVPAHQLVLDDGSPPEYATSYLGGVRLRLAPHPLYVDKARLQRDRWIVEVLSEPKVQWQGSLALLWDEATEGKGRRLAAVPTVEELPKDQDPGPGDDGGSAMIMQFVIGGGDDEAVAPKRLQNVRRQEIPLKWILPPGAGAQTATLRGRLKGMVLAESAVVRTADVKKAGSDPIAGKRGFRLTVKELLQRNGGKARMEIAVKSPARTDVRQRGGMPSIPIEVGRRLGNHGFHVWDGKGSPYQISVRRMSANGDVTIYRLILTPPAKDSVPTKLEFHASYPAEVEQSFAFHDIHTP